MMIEWTGYDQLRLLGMSILLGGCLGLLFSLFNMAAKFRRRKLLFACDVLFLLIASLATFFFSLATMDGYLHPLLFVGCVVGFVLFHVAIGRCLSRWVYRFGRWLLIMIRRLIGLIFLPFRLAFSAVRRAFSSICVTSEKKAEKSRKKCAFFQKNS